MHDTDLLIRDKYHGDASKVTENDLKRLAAGEPLAYVIGWVPFLGLEVRLDSRPLIPRLETEWWAEMLVKRIGNHPYRVLDLCAGSGAIGLAVLKHCPNAIVSFGELVPAHTELIRKNILENGLDASRAFIRAGDLFEQFANDTFDIIATNPPYVPEDRTLDASVTNHEPREALLAGSDGLALIRRIASAAPSHLTKESELWLECDAFHAPEAASLLRENGASRADVLKDLYGRDRLVLAYY